MPFNLDPALPRMTGTSQADPGFEGILQILDGIPAERLIQYRHKLSCSHQDRKSCHLLHVMILWSLGREDEARVQLDSFGDDVVAHHLSQRLWGMGGAKRTTPDQLKDHAKVAQSVADIYSLLVDEKLCEPLARDEAYREAIQAFKVSHIEGAQLKGLLDEAMEKCGLQFISTVPRNNFGALASSRGELTSPRRSNLVSINSSSPPDNPQSLRSTGSPISYISNLKISESSITSDSPPSTGSSLSLPPTSQEEDTSSVSLVNGCSTNSRKPSLPNSRGPFLLPDPKIRLSPKVSAQGPPTPKTAPTGDLTPTFQSPSLPKPSSTPSAGGGPRRSSAPAPITSFEPLLSSSFSTSDLPSCSSEPSSMDPPDDERQFYTFVVLHATEDELVACRVKEHLEALGVSNGATFSEDFLIPGHGQLNCFQNALDNSAFTLVLLTKNFTGRLCDYQRDTALMDSFTRCCKRYSVIPFVPMEHSLNSREMPLLLASLTPLDENSPLFDKRVKKTFTPKVIQKKKDTWDLLRQIQAREEERERERENLRLQQRLAVLNLQPSAALPPLVDMSRMQAQAGNETQVFPPPTTPFVNLGLDQASFSQPFLSSVGAPNAMPGPQLIIQNAQMVQIGDYNNMQVERSNATVGTANETVERAPVMKRENPGE